MQLLKMKIEKKTKKKVEENEYKLMNFAFLLDAFQIYINLNYSLTQIYTTIKIILEL